MKANRFLLLLLLVSISTNAAFVARVLYPQQFARIRLSMYRVPPAAKNDHVSGQSDAKVTVIEYADFQCPYCAAMHRIMQRVVRDSGVRWVYRHYPIPVIHPQARLAAEAAECAADQGQFWQYAALLYSNQEEIAALPLTRFAAKSGLDLIKFRNCMQSGKHVATVDRHVREGTRLRISGTPTFFINGKRFEGFSSEADLRAAILAAT